MGQKEEGEAYPPQDYDQDAELLWPRQKSEKSVLAKLLEQVVSSLFIAGIIGVVGFGISTGTALIQHTETLDTLRTQDNVLISKMGRLEIAIRDIQLALAEGPRWTELDEEKVQKEATRLRELQDKKIDALREQITNIKILVRSRNYTDSPG